MRVFTRLSELTWVLPKLRILPEPAPRDVTADEDCADDAPYDTEEEEGEKLDEYPRIVVLDVEEDRVLVAERVDGLEQKYISRKQVKPGFTNYQPRFSQFFYQKK